MSRGRSLIERMADLTDDIEDNAGKPRAVTVDGQTVEQQSLPDQIAADKYLKAATATAQNGNATGNGYRGINLFKFRAGGA